MATAQPTKVVTGKVRLSYVTLFEPKQIGEKDDKKFSCVIVIPKTDKRTLKAIERAQQAAIEAKWGSKAPRRVKNTLHDGDEEADLERNPEYEGCMYMNISSKQRPGVVDSGLNPIMDATEVYSGCYARVSMVAFAYDYEGTKGVSFGLRNVQKVADGQPLGGVSLPEDDFEIEDDEDDDDLL